MCDGLKKPLKPEVKFDIIDVDSVLHHLIGRIRTESVRLIHLFCKQLKDRLSENGSLVVEVYVFYGMKLLNFLRLDVSKLVGDLLPGLEVNFLHHKQIEELLE
ncbi:MAG: hypothetical protein M3044_17325 [Thermoproteota archaeon]|nr:hypothetical protein [Thermoproteota archaeon]